MFLFCLVSKLCPLQYWTMLNGGHFGFGLKTRFFYGRFWVDLFLLWRIHVRRERFVNIFVPFKLFFISTTKYITDIWGHWNVNVSNAKRGKGVFLQAEQEYINKESLLFLQRCQIWRDTGIFVLKVVATCCISWSLKATIFHSHARTLLPILHASDRNVAWSWKRVKEIVSRKIFFWIFITNTSTPHFPFTTHIDLFNTHTRWFVMDYLRLYSAHTLLVSHSYAYFEASKSGSVLPATMLRGW